jgi:hypothetical protein
LAQLAHSGETRLRAGSPNTVAPTSLGCATACARALATGRRASDATATAALSMMRSPIISTRPGSAATVSAATSAIRHASCYSLGEGSLDRWLLTSYDFTVRSQKTSSCTCADVSDDRQRQDRGTVHSPPVTLSSLQNLATPGCPQPRPTGRPCTIAQSMVPKTLRSGSHPLLLPLPRAKVGQMSEARVIQ